MSASKGQTAPKAAPAIIPTPSASMADAVMDVLHISELSALLCDGDELTMAQLNALAAGITALADATAQRLTDQLNAVEVAA